MNIELKQLSVEEIETIKSFFADVFMKEPWNDDWSDKEQFQPMSFIRKTDFLN